MMNLCFAFKPSFGSEAKASKNLSAVSGVAYNKPSAILPALVAPNVAPNTVNRTTMFLTVVDVLLRSNSAQGRE